ncbi:MAG: GlcNAc-transferase family protein [Rhodoferax sp.]
MTIAWPPACRRCANCGWPTFKSHTLPYDQRPAQPIPNAFVGAGCLFAPAAAFDEVPYDPHLYFHGEEIILSARLWTHGWDFFAPNDVLMYHDYRHNRGRPKHWEDHTDWSQLNRRSVMRIHHLLAGVVATDPAALEDIEAYRLGHARSLQDYERLAGVDFARCVIHAAKPADLEPDSILPGSKTIAEPSQHHSE